MRSGWTVILLVRRVNIARFPAIRMPEALFLHDAVQAAALPPETVPVQETEAQETDADGLTEELREALENGQLSESDAAALTQDRTPLIITE